jgi:hypothetical protein
MTYKFETILPTGAKEYYLKISFQKVGKPIHYKRAKYK